MSWTSLIAAAAAGLAAQDGGAGPLSQEYVANQRACQLLGAPIEGREPRSPDRLAAKGVSGLVLARLTIRNTGEVSHVEIRPLPPEHKDRDGGPRFENQVLRAVEEWRFNTFEGADRITCDWLFDLQP